MVTVGADGGVVRAVFWTSRVIVDDGLVAEVHDVERAVRTDAHFDGTEPDVFSADEFGRLAPGFAMRGVGNTVGIYKLVVDEVHGRLRAEVGVVPFRGPRATVVNRAAGRGGEFAHPVNLHVG